MGVGGEAATMSSSGVMFKYMGAASVLKVSPAVAMVNGGSALSLVVAGAADGSAAWCMEEGRVVVAAESVSGGVVQCVSVAGVGGNTSVEVSVNGQEFTSSGMLVERVALANVTSVMPGVVPVGGGVPLHHVCRCDRWHLLVDRPVALAPLEERVASKHGSPWPP